MERVAKYVYMLQITTGMGYSDVTSLTREHYKRNNYHNRWYINKARKKSGVRFHVVLSETAKHSMDELQKLVGTGTHQLFNLPKLRVLNKCYRKLANRVEIEKFTSYDLRHTFAVDYMDNGGTIEDLAEILGHVKLETTRIYGEISKERLNNSMKNIEANSTMHQMK